MEPALRWTAVAALACVAGTVVLLAAGGSQTATFIAIVLGGTAFVLVVSGAFYAVGRSEDRDRERSRRPPDRSH